LFCYSFKSSLFFYSIGPALIQFRDDSQRRVSPPVLSAHFDEHQRHHLPSTDEQLMRLSTSSSSTHFQPHFSSLPPSLLGRPTSPTRLHHAPPQHHQFGNNIIQGQQQQQQQQQQPPPLLPTPTNADEHQKQSPFPRRPNRFEEREDTTQSHDNNANYAAYRGGRGGYNDRINSSAISRGANRGRGGQLFE
jgi:hypothetical protein